MWHILAKVLRVVARAPAILGRDVHLPAAALAIAPVLLVVADALDPHRADPPEAEAEPSIS